MNLPFTCPALWAVLAFIVVLPEATRPARAEGKRHALLVGVDTYEHRTLPSSRYAGADVAELAGILRQHGWTCTVLCDAAGKENPSLIPTRANVQNNLRRIAQEAAAEDIVLFGFSGHGLQFSDRKDAYLLPRDARPHLGETETMISFSTVLAEMEKSFAGFKLLLIDAARDDPDPGRGRDVAVSRDIFRVPLPNGFAALFSCSAGEKAFEHGELKHGVFFHSVIGGLNGKACNSGGHVTFLTLAEHVQRDVPKQVERLFPSRSQNPQLLTNLPRPSPILVDGNNNQQRNGKDQHEPTITPQR